MCPRRQANDQYPSGWIAKGWYRTAPIVPLEVRAPLPVRDILAVPDQPGTAPAGYDLCL